MTLGRAPILNVVEQHAEESIALRDMRAVLLDSPHVKLLHLQRLDERLAAHLDGLGVASDFGWRLCEAELQSPGIGQVFVAAVRAIEDDDSRRLDRVFALVEAVPEAEHGLMSAFGWVPGRLLRGTVKSLLESSTALRRRVGIVACSMHGVDPGSALDAAMKDSDSGLRARALRAAGELGRRDSLAAMRRAIDDGDKDDTCRFWAAWSAVLLGDRGKALDLLAVMCQRASLFREIALQLVLRAMELPPAQELLRIVKADPKSIRVLIEGVGIVGDPRYVPWLIEQMADPKLSRLAGESFTFTTGLDLSYLDLDRRPPEDEAIGASADPDDENVAMDPDESLPLPDAEKLAKWWDANQHAFTSGVRHFMGAPVSWTHCLQVLKEGYQRQRAAAALHLSLLRPETPLFDWRAPAWRQRRRLAAIR